MKKVIIIGGGLAGLISSILLSRKGFECAVFEKKQYPFHRVCGEYISNETIPFLKRENLFPEELHPATIDTFQLSAVSGKSTALSLESGGFGISRYAFDHFLYQKALEAGVVFHLNTEVTGVEYVQNHFLVRTQQKEYTAPIVIGAYGKRSKLDAQLKRNFFSKRSPYIGAKYHIQCEHPKNVIALHNFSGGYCGISNVENGITNLCYLAQRSDLKKFKSIDEFEKNVLWHNPHLKRIFSESHFYFERPEVINEISFETKEAVYNHILMAGDTAGMITPLCGNGMAMAIHSAKIVSDAITNHVTKTSLNRKALECEYTQQWKKNFAVRLWVGRQIQNKLFGGAWSSDLAVKVMLYNKFLARTIIKNTHGVPF